MTLTAEQLQQVIIGTLGDETPTSYPGGVLAALLPLIWTYYAQTVTDPAVQFLSSKRDAIDALIGAVRSQVQMADADTGATVFLQQKADALLKFRADVVNDLTLATAAAKSGITSGAPPRVGSITTRAPITPVYPFVDANSERYRGSPYYVSPWGTTYPSLVVNEDGTP